MDNVDNKTFWMVIGALAVAGLTLSVTLFRLISDHDEKPYHKGVQMYVEERVSRSYDELRDSIERLRNEQALRDQKLREALVSKGIIDPIRGL